MKQIWIKCKGIAKKCFYSWAKQVIQSVIQPNLPKISLIGNRSFSTIEVWMRVDEASLTQARYKEEQLKTVADPNVKDNAGWCPLHEVSISDKENSLAIMKNKSISS